ncbi:MAG TPA: hypothetical protein VFH43_11615 [Candidatus Kapabacteria bacterium]|nr:hypothetical protein [Candidatus Kapabacteria bacterium]
MIKLIPVLALVAFGAVKSEPKPVLQSPRNFYRAGDTAEVSIVRDTAIDVAFCVVQQRATFFYTIEQLVREGEWMTVYNTSAVCQANMASVMRAEKGFTIKHLMRDKGTFRVVVSNVYRSNEFEIR